MDAIKTYQKLADIKPQRHRTVKPFNRASNTRFIFNLEDQELQYNRNFEVYLNNETVKSLDRKKGGAEGCQKINVISFDPNQN